MVDEFQDTNRVQLELVEQLRGAETRVFMVGDEHQSIYRFRNADLEVFRAGARGRERGLRARGAAAARQLPLAAGRARGASTRSATRCSDDFAPLTAGRAPTDGPERSSSC